MEAKSNRHLLRFVSIQADAAAQTAFMLPMQLPVTHGIDRYETGSFDALPKVSVVLLDFLTRPAQKVCFCSICFGRNYQPVSQEKLPPGICALLVLIAQARQSL